MLRVAADSATAHHLARARGFKNYDLVKRVIFESGEHNDIGVNCVRDFATQERMRRDAAVRYDAGNRAWAARRDAR
jgi:UDP-N-acetylmuramyl tripeptide synthase